MARKKVRLAWVENNNSRVVSLKKRRLRLSKKVQELTILCDVRAFIIVFSPNETEPMVWPSVETARDLLDDFFALPEFERRKRETNLQSYLEEKTRKVQEQLMKTQQKLMEYLTDQLMVQLQHGRVIDDLSMSEINTLLSYSKVKIMLCKKRLDFMQHPPLRDSPVPPFEVQFKSFRTITDDTFVGGGQIDTVSYNKSQYILDQWVFSSEPPVYQGSSSNGNPHPNLEMELIGPQEINFLDFFGSVSQPLQYYTMNANPTIAINQPMQYPFNSMSRELGVQDEGSNINNGNSKIHRSITISANDGLRQEPPPNGETTREENVDATPFDINKVWSGLNNRHF